MTTHTALDQAALEALARRLAARAVQPCVFLLSGPLGAGKSTFARAFIRSLTGESTEVPSPTFTLVQIYDEVEPQIWHFDLYRLQSSDEMFELGWDDAVQNGRVLVEWPDRLGPYRPPQACGIHIEPEGESDRRSVTLSLPDSLKGLFG